MPHGPVERTDLVALLKPFASGTSATASTAKPEAESFSASASREEIKLVLEFFYFQHLIT